MSVADVPQPTTAGPAAPPTPPGERPPHPAPVLRRPAHAAPGSPTVRRGAPRGGGLSPGAGRLLAVAFAVAWILCPAVEPMPTGPDAVYPLWQLPIDLAAVASIIAAVVALWRGSRHAARLGMAAGVLMAVMTIVCPLAGHTPVGWWTWLQTGLSLFVLVTSAALYRRMPAADRS